MKLSDILFSLLIEPLYMIFEIIYAAAYKMIGNPGISIIAMSMVMNLILLPMYRRADAIQMEAIETEKKMKPQVQRIKKAFHGNEQFMMLQTCYRQNHYKPYDALKGICPLMLEIPFFMGAYKFLSGLGALQAQSFGPIPDLSVPDGMICVFGITVNVLPIVMTLINLVSSAIYTKDAPMKTKLQLYGMAGLFLVLLYDSPSGLVLYWTMNNLFSLVKNFIVSTRNPRKSIVILCSSFSVLCLAAVFTGLRSRGILLRSLCVLAAAALNLPLVMGWIRKIRPVSADQKDDLQTKKGNYLLFLCAGAVLTALIGALIPSSVIVTGPLAFVQSGKPVTPLVYIQHVTIVAAGLFIVWMGVFYGMATPRWKRYAECGAWILCGIALFDYMLFPGRYGLLSVELIYNQSVHSEYMEILQNFLILAFGAMTVWIIWRNFPRVLKLTGLTVLLAVLVMSAVNMTKIAHTYREYQQRNQQINTEGSSFKLSKTGNNVVVLMLDRGVSSFFPYILQEKPELQQQFAGFTYYPETLSFGAHTNFGLPAVFGGYEYTPLELNRRSDELLVDKHNEAMKVLPVLFDEQAYRVTVSDPTYAGYSDIPQLSIYEDYPHIEAHLTNGVYAQGAGTGSQNFTNICQRFFYYGIFRSSPMFLREYLYMNGKYLSTRQTGQICKDTLYAEGQNADFDNSYSVLQRLPQLTEILEGEENTFQMMCNNTTHSPQMLQLPDYVPRDLVDNSAYDSEVVKRVDLQGNKIFMNDPEQITHYHCNMAAYLQIGKWLDYLRENDVYDNTRIIIVSDHGYWLNLLGKFPYDLETSREDHSDIMFYNPILLVKDFNSRELKVDHSFMTNADVPYLCTEGLIEKPVNPFTGKEITSQPHKQGSQTVSLSGKIDLTENCGTTYLPDPWAEVTGDLFDPDSWHVKLPEEVS